MTPITVLLWKEWRELRWFLITGLGIFLILPLIGAAQGHWLHNQRLVVEASPWVATSSGALAVFIAVGSSCRDLSDKLMVFWRSRPISVGQWLATKYLSGLALVLLLCMLPLVVELTIKRAHGRAADEVMILLAWHPFVVMAIYSVAFLLGCLVRQVTQAAMLSLAAMLLIYFLPYVLPPLNWLSFALMMEASERLEWNGASTAVTYIGRLPWRVAYTPMHLHYVLGMLAISVLSAIAAWIAVRKDMRISADRKVMYWSIGLAGLLLLWATAYQVGSNLPVQQEMAMPGENQMARTISVNGNHAVLLTADDWSLPQSISSGFVTTHLWPLEVSSSGVKVGRAVTLPRRNDGSYIWVRDNLKLAGDGQHAYMLAWSEIGEVVGVAAHPELLTVRLDGEGNPVAHRLDLGREPAGGNWAMHLVGNRLYIVMGPRLAAVDISDPSLPHLLWSRRCDPVEIGPRQSRPLPEVPLAEIWVNLLDLEGMSPRERLEVTVRLATSEVYCLSGDVLIGHERDGLAAYHLASLTDRQARFELAGHCRPTAIESLVTKGWESLTSRNGVLYGTRWSSSGTVDLTVYDVGDPQHVRRTGHFAAPSRNYTPAMSPLPDGRMLVGGTRLYLLGRPRGN